MKKLLALTFAFAALLILVGCESSTTPDQPTVTYDVIDDGGGLTLTWSADANADGFIIYHDNFVVDTVVGTTYTDTVPCLVIGVSAYAGDLESAKDEIDCTPVETAALIVYGNTDPDTTHPSGFGFNAGGSAIAYSLSNTSNHPLLDYYINSVPATPQFTSPSDHLPTPYNGEYNSTVNSGSTNYTTETIADAPGGYSTQTNITANAVYFFYIDPDNDGWGSSNDYFGKVQVTGVNGLANTLKLAYQGIAGLRWCVTP